MDVSAIKTELASLKSASLEGLSADERRNVTDRICKLSMLLSWHREPKIDLPIPAVRRETPQLFGRSRAAGAEAEGVRS